MAEAEVRSRAAAYERGGGVDVLEVVESTTGAPGPGEVRVRMAFSGINPLDCKERQVAEPGVVTIPHYDGSGWIDAVGAGVHDLRRGDPVWVFLARRGGRPGTAQSYVIVPRGLVRRLPDAVPLIEGACVGMPALTAYRCLTVHGSGPRGLLPGALEGLSVLVPGGAGAVGNAAVQLAKWAGARVLTTVRGPVQVVLAMRAGADVVVDRTSLDAVQKLDEAAAGGVDIVVEVDPVGNAEQSARLCGPGSVVAVYGRGGADSVTLSMSRLMAANVRYQWVRLPSLPDAWVQRAATEVSAVIEAGALRFGESRGMPIRVFPLDQVASAHEHAAQSGAGKTVVEFGREIRMTA